MNLDLFRVWTEELNYAEWQQVSDIDLYDTADLLGKNSNRIVFDIGGNNLDGLQYVFSARQVTVCLLDKQADQH